MSSVLATPNGRLIERRSKSVLSRSQFCCCRWPLSTAVDAELLSEARDLHAGFTNAALVGGVQHACRERDGFAGTLCIQRDRVHRGSLVRTEYDDPSPVCCAPTASTG